MHQDQLDQIQGLLDPTHKTLRQKFEEEKFHFEIPDDYIPFDDS